MAPPVSTSTTTASELAHAYGVREDEPERWRTLSKDKSELDRQMKLVAEITDSALAEFTSRYLPSLLAVLRAQSPDSPLCYNIVTLLCPAQSLPQFSRAVHRLPAASDLPTLLVKRLLTIPVDGLRQMPAIQSATALAKARDEGFPLALARPYQVIGTLFTLISGALSFGPASTLDFRLEPALAAELVEAGDAMLSTPILRAATEVDLIGEHSKGNLAPSAKVELRSVLAYLVRAAEKGSELARLQQQLYERSRSPEAAEWYVCGGITHSLEDCNKDAELMQCSNCLTIAYCSARHQRQDWKEHKRVCFKPCW